eukprot:2949391-Amphidinium_carterae.1
MLVCLYGPVDAAMIACKACNPFAGEILLKNVWGRSRNYILDCDFQVQLLLSSGWSSQCLLRTCWPAPPCLPQPKGPTVCWQQAVRCHGGRQTRSPKRPGKTLDICHLYSPPNDRELSYYDE